MGSPKEAAMAEMLCLQWDEFKQNTSSAFANFRGDPDLMDVTLACVDGQQIKAHKVIVAGQSHSAVFKLFNSIDPCFIHVYR